MTDSVLARLSLAVVLVSAAGCQNKPGPAAPSSVVGSGTLVCPTGVLAFTIDGSAVPVTFTLPTLGGSDQIVDKAVCSPGPGSVFPVGKSPVNCVVPFGIGPLASCGFQVTVFLAEPPPTLGPTSPSGSPGATLTTTNILAFGDSITQGFVSPAFSVLSFGSAYPTKLREGLTARYPAQPIRVENFGLGGEFPNRGRQRLPSALSEANPDLLLLMEGINGISLRSHGETASELRAMAVTAVARGVKVLMGTLTPVSDARELDEPGAQGNIRAVNSLIFDIAAELGLPRPVDVYALFTAEPSLLGRDGKHPTAEGYRRLAGLFEVAIAESYESAPPVNPPPNPPGPLPTLTGRLQLSTPAATR